jgi:hypothetical protein
MSKRIVRLSESQLRDMIKRVVSEQPTPMAKPAAQPAQQSATNDPDYKTAWGIMGQLMNAIQGVGTDEDAVLKAVNFVRTQKIYNYLLQIVQKSPTVKQKTGSNYNLVMDYILTDFQVPMIDKPAYTSRRVNRNSSAWDSESGISLDKDSQITSKAAAILGKFNEKEGYAWYDNASEDKPV